jgi:DNA polymerase III alpha subunit
MQAETIVGIKYIGLLPTIDISVEDKQHVFYANGIVSSNSHSVAYGKNAYVTAYYKVNETLLFYCEYFKYAKDSDELKELIYDAYANGIKIKCPNIKDRQLEFYVKNGEICFGLCNLRGFGESAYKKLFDKLEGNLDNLNWTTFLINYSKYVSSTGMDALIFSGALDCFNIPRSQMWHEYTHYEKLTIKEQGRIDNETGVNLADVIFKMVPFVTKNRKPIVESIGKSISIQLSDQIDDVINAEERILGASITYARIEKKGKKNVKKDANELCTIKDVVDGQKGQLRFLAEVTNVKDVKLTKGKNAGLIMGFVDLFDKTGQLQGVMCFPDNWDIYKGFLYDGNIVLVHCNRSKNGEILFITGVEQQ